MTTTNQPPIRNYGNWRKPQAAGLFGLGKMGTRVLYLALGVSLLVTILGDILAGGTVFTVFAAFLLLLLRRDEHGRSQLTKMADRSTYSGARRKGSTLYRGGPLGPGKFGDCRLPGLAASTKLREGVDSTGRPFALLEMPRKDTFTIVITTEPDGAALVDQEQIDSWVADWGMFMRALCDEADIVAASVTIETAPDTGERLAREVESNLDPAAPAFALQVMRDIVVTYPTGSATARAFVALTFASQIRTGGRKRPLEEMARSIGTRLPGITARLEETGAGASHPLSAQQLTDYIRIAYDPAAATLIDETHRTGHTSGITWNEAGPTAHQAGWDTYRHDGATSITWQMTSAPQGNVQSNILTGFLSPHHMIARKRVTLLYRPISTAKAPKVADKDINDASFNTGAKKRRPSARDLRLMRQAERSAEEEASGAGLVNFGLVATATVIGSDATALGDAAAAVENLAQASRLGLRIIHGGQDTGFVSALPLGIVIPDHLTVPSEVTV